MKKGDIEFQSLIGMMKTNLFWCELCQHSLFQSLIGMMKTCGHIEKDVPCYEFQSLIGMMKTNESTGISCGVHTDVSIPHRYDENTLIIN